MPISRFIRREDLGDDAHHEAALRVAEEMITVREARVIGDKLLNVGEDHGQLLRHRPRRVETLEQWQGNEQRARVLRRDPLLRIRERQIDTKYIARTPQKGSENPKGHITCKTILVMIDVLELSLLRPAKDTGLHREFFNSNYYKSILISKFSTS